MRPDGAFLAAFGPGFKISGPRGLAWFSHRVNEYNASADGI